MYRNAIHIYCVGGGSICRKPAKRKEITAMEDIVKDTTAIGLIGDGVLTMLRPKRHVWLWAFGPESYRDAMKEFAARPGMTQLIAAAEIGIGLLLAYRAED